MNKLNRLAIFGFSVLFVFSVFSLAGDIRVNPVKGAGPSYSIELVASDPAVIDGGTFSGTKAVKGVTFDYEGAENATGYHTELRFSGSISNAASTQITSIVGITAVFDGPGSLSVGASYQHDTVSTDYATLSSGVEKLYDDDFYFFKVQASIDGDVYLSSLTITYSCAPAEYVINYERVGDAYEVASVSRDPFTVTIPATYLTLPVTAIQEGVFYTHPSLRNIIIENGLIEIRDGAFSGCYNLSSAVLPDTLTNIFPGAFNQTYSLTAITFPMGLISIGDNGFMDSGLLHVDLPDSCQYLGPNAFNNCVNLVDVVIPMSLTDILDGTFASCTSLSAVFFKGDAARWDAMTFGSNNESLTALTPYYYHEGKPMGPGYWHYVDNVPTIWLS